jgi:sugar O-acyltransferase (sialic acid O-acetyltransferase NeuD family)
MTSIVVIGGGGHAKVVMSILRKMKAYRILGYTDLRDSGTLLGFPYLGSDIEFASRSVEPDTQNAVLAVGQVGLGTVRQQVWQELQSHHLCFPFIVSPHAIVNEEVSGGEAAMVMDGAVVNFGTALGRGAIVNTNSTVEHDVVIKDWVHIAPGSTICGGVTVGQFSMIGAGATVIQGIKIADSCVVGAGATVICDLTESGVYVGSPARRIK